MSNGLIFVSYRRDDAAGYARAIYDQLVQHFSKERVFMDVAAIEPGLPFDEAIEKAVGQCEVLLAVIDRSWLNQRAGAGPRINDPKDFVRLEIAAALSRNIRVVPVLLDGAKMPSEEELPEPLRALTRRHAIEVSNSSFRSDVESLISAVKRALGEPVGHPPIPHGRTRSILYWLAGVLAAGALAVAIYFQVDRNRAVPSLPSKRDQTTRPMPVNPTPTAKNVETPSSSSDKESEPNNIAPSANTILFGSRVQGMVESDDRDLFKFTIPSDMQGKTRVILRKLSRDGFNAQVNIEDKNEKTIAYESARYGTSVSLVLDSIPNSVYFVSVIGLFGEKGPYELEIREE